MIVHSDAKSVSIPVPDMSALIARLEAAEAGSRPLDYAIRDALNDPHWNIRVPADWSTSLDAALALAERVLPGRWIRSFDEWPARTVQEALAGIPHWPDNSWRVTVTQDGGGHGQFSGVSLTPALALCIAILKAKAQGEGG